jgi:hypothetical protein
LAVGETISFSIPDCVNPDSSAPTSAFKLFLKDGEGRVVSEASVDGLQMEFGATIQKISFEATDNR